VPPVAGVPPVVLPVAGVPPVVLPVVGVVPDVPGAVVELAGSDIAQQDHNKTG
jgi:hypothetical protein